MTDTLEETIDAAKEVRRKGQALAGMQAMDAEGLLPKSGDTEKPSAFANSAVRIADAEHGAPTENVQQTHSNVKESIITPIIEIALIQEAVRKENAAFKKYKSVDELTQFENDIIEAEISEIHTDILQLLVSLNGRGRDDAGKDLQSMVAGEAMREQNAALAMSANFTNPGLFGRAKKFFVGGK